MAQRLVSATLLLFAVAASAGGWTKPKPGYLDYRVGLTLWPKKSDGLGLKTAVTLTELTCELDETGPHSTQVCAPTNKPLPRTAPGGSTMDEMFLARLGLCLAVERAVVPKPTLKVVQDQFAALVDAGTVDREALTLPVAAPLEVRVLRLRHRQLQPEFRGGGCEGGPSHGANGQLIGCDPVVTATGRVVENSHERLLVSKPPGWASWEPFAPNYLDAYWVQIGESSSNTEGNVTYPKFVEDPKLPDHPNVSSALPEPEKALASIKDYPFKGPPEVKAALLSNTALAFFLLKDKEKGREATAKLEAFLAANPVNRGLLMLNKTLDALNQAGSEEWLLSDPCEAP